MPTETGPFVMRLIVAAALSAVIGLEREYHRKAAGLRTNMLIGLGSALFTILSVSFAQGGQGSSDRVAAQIATGIGFLGAGAYTLAVGTTVVTMVILAVLPPIETFFDRWARRRGEEGSPRP